MIWIESLQQGKREKIRVEDVSLDNPPKGISLVSENGMTEITINRKPPLAQSIVGALIISILPLIFMYVGFFVKGAPVIFGIAGMLFECIIIGGIVWSLTVIPQLRINADAVQLFFLTPWGVMERERLAKAGIEQVSINSSEGNRSAGKFVVLKSDSGEIRFGEIDLTGQDCKA